MGKYKAINSEIFIEQGEGNAAVAYIYHACSDDSEEDKRIATLFAAAPELLEALERYESFFASMFAECCSNPVYNTWGKALDLTLLNEAHLLSEPTIKKALGK